MAYLYIPAKYQWPRRAGYSPSLLVLHSMEAPEKGDTAESCARYFQTIKKPASAHLCIDNNSVVQSVPFNRKAAGAAGNNANDKGIHFEHAGYARQTPADWDDPYSKQMLALSCLAAADVCKTYNIPAVRLSQADIRNGRAGICQHLDITYAYSVVGGHTDPGPGFPMNTYVATVLYLLNTPPDPEDDMFTDEDRALIKALQEQVKYLTHVQDDIIRPKLDAVYIDTHADDHNTTMSGRVLNIAKELNVPTTDV